MSFICETAKPIELSLGIVLTEKFLKPSPFSETAEPIEQKFTSPINTTPIRMKFCGKLPCDSEMGLG